MTRILLAVSLLGIAACAEIDANRDPDDPSNQPSSDTPDSLDNPKPADVRFDPVSTIMAGTDAQCMSDGPCSPACTGGMVINLHVPTGQCMTFDCSVSGGPSDVGGCHP
jgi:hypothetical protein